MLLHCAHALYVWNLAVEQRSYWARHKGPLPGYVELARQLTEAGAASEWLRDGNAVIQQQALRDFDQAVQRRFKSGFGEPTWRKKFRHEGFRVIGTDSVPAFGADGAPKLNAKGKQVMSRSVRIERLNRRWARVKVPGCGPIRFRLTKGRGLPEAKSFRVTYRNGQWHVAFAVIPPAPKAAPGTGEPVGVDRGVTITAALSDGRKLNCPQLTPKEWARYRKHQRRAARAPKGSDRKAAEYAKAAKIRVTEVARRKDWVEKTSTMLASEFDLIRFEKLNIKNMAASARARLKLPAEASPKRPGSIGRSSPRAGVPCGGAPSRRPSAGSRTSRPLHQSALQRLRMDREGFAQELSGWFCWARQGPEVLKQWSDLRKNRLLGCPCLDLSAAARARTPPRSSLT
ncbi:hypothetical protein GCM10029992_55880 [Glycomyces albus]